MSIEELYKKKLGEMLVALENWKATKKPAVIQFNFPNDTVIAATISDALSHHFVTADAGGIELLTAFGMGTPDEPSVLMVWAVIEGHR